MTDDPALDFAALLCSRLCHDLISPLSAVSAGVELLQDVADEDEEVALVGESAAAAQAALSFFRVAFGAAEPEGRAMSTRELGALTLAYLQRGRLRVDWPDRGDDLPRPAARALLLLAMTAAAAAPLGGEAAVAPPQAFPLRLEIVVEGRRAGLAEPAARLLAGAPGARAEAPREAPFAFCARAAAALGAQVSVAQEDERVRLILAAP
jgi:histidine phosphotransferase ChpT